MSGQLKRAPSIIVACCLIISLLAGHNTLIANAAQANQGLQGGWAVNDSGQIQFTHSLSSEYPFMQQAGAGWVRINFRLGACFSDWTTPTTTCQNTAYAPTATAIYDRIVSTALNDHLAVLGLLSNESWPGSQTDWTASNAENTGGNGSNSYITSFASSAAGHLATHFAGKITHWEVWNEPNAWTFGATFAAGLRRRRVRAGDKWHLDEVALKIRGKRHWLRRAVDQHGVVLDILVQERRDQAAAERFLHRVLDGEGGAEPRAVITDKLASYPPAIKRVLSTAEHRRHKGLNNRAENSHLPTRKRERVLQRFKSAEHAQRFLGPFQRRLQPLPSA